MGPSDHERSAGRARVLPTLLLCTLLLGAAAAASYMIFASEPTAKSERQTRRSPAPVETTVAELGTHRPRLRVLGVVTPALDVQLAPRVRGQVLELAPSLVPGGRVRADEELLRIDPADFEYALTARDSERLQVEAELEIEEGRQVVARQELDLLGDDIDSTNRSLVLREPQIASLRARLQSTEAALAQARLDLERTVVRAPFDAQVLGRSVNVGSQVQPGDTLARLVGIEEYWVLASVQLRDLRWLRFHEEGDEGAAVRVRHTTAWAPGVFRQGRLARLIGTVDGESRLARVLVTVADPLGIETDGPPLIVDTIVQLEIEGRALEDVVRIERDHLRQNDTVWVLADDALEIRPVEVVFRDAEHAYLGGGLEAGELVVTTNLASVTEGLPLRQADGPLDGPLEGTDGGEEPEQR